MYGKALGQALIDETRFRLLDESLPRIVQCLHHLSEDEIWWRPNAQTVSIGNLVIHLCGNVRQWIVSGLGGAPDNRVRDAEFAEVGPIPTAHLMAQLTETMAEAGRTLDGLDPESLLGVRRVQGGDETGVSILVHVAEHFSYHTGQITYAVKSRKNVDLGYYAGLDLNQTG